MQGATATPAISSAPPNHSSFSFASLLRMIAGDREFGTPGKGAVSVSNREGASAAKLTAGGGTKSSNVQSADRASSGQSAQTMDGSAQLLVATAALNAVSATQPPSGNLALHPVASSVTRAEPPAAQSLLPTNAVSAVQLPTGSAGTQRVTPLETNIATVAKSSSFQSQGISAMHVPAPAPETTAVPSSQAEDVPAATDSATSATQQVALNQDQAGDGLPSTAGVSMVSAVVPETNGTAQALTSALAAEDSGPKVSVDSTPDDVASRPAALPQASVADNIAPVTTVKDASQLVPSADPATAHSAYTAPVEIAGQPWVDKSEVGKPNLRVSVAAVKQQPQPVLGSATVSSVPASSVTGAKTGGNLPLNSSSKPPSFSPQAELTWNAPSGGGTVTHNADIFDPAHSGESQLDREHSPNSRTSGAVDASPSSPPPATGTTPTAAPAESTSSDKLGAPTDTATPTSLTAMATSSGQEPTTETTTGATVERPAQPAAEAALTQPPGADQVQAARMVNGALQSEMHIGLRTQAFGNVEVHTVVHENQLGLTLGSERGNLRGLLNSEVPSLQTAFRQQDLRLETIRFLEGSGTTGSALSGGGDQQARSFSQSSTAPQSTVADEGADANERPDAAEEDLDLTGNTKLSVLA